VELVRENITVRQIFGIEIGNYLFKKLVLNLAVFVVKILCPVFSYFRLVFSKTVFSPFKNCVVYLAIFVVYLAKPNF